MPYIHWELEEKRVEMNEVINDAVSSWSHLTHTFKGKKKRKRRERKTNDNPSKVLLKYYLTPEAPEAPRSQVHVRRTLDQFQYYMTDNTDDRDSDQVISRYFGRRYPGTDKPVMMIDQLWLWILDDSKHCILVRDYCPQIFWLNLH